MAVKGGVRRKSRTASGQNVPAGSVLTDGYEILDDISINKKVPFVQLLDIITRNIIESIGRVHVKKIYLFGSHAYGKPNKYSDIDLCVVISNRISKSKAHFNISKGLSEKRISSLDILLYSEKEYDDRKYQAGIVGTIFTMGKMLYG